MTGAGSMWSLSVATEADYTFRLFRDLRILGDNIVDVQLIVDAFKIYPLELVARFGKVGGSSPVVLQFLSSR